MGNDVPPDASRRGEILDDAAAAADRDALLELIAVFTHDLNNPLQTVLVLSELALDETMPGTEGRTRAEQCLAAADRLRVLAQAMSGLFRGRPLRGDALWDRLKTLLGRRFERHGIVAELAPCLPADAMVPALAERIVFTLGLGAIAAAAASGRRQHALELSCATTAERVAIDARLFVVDSDAQRLALPFPAAHLARLAAVVRQDPGADYRVSDNHIHIALASGG